MASAHALTLTDLARAGACAPQRELFVRLAPDGVPLSELEARCVEHGAAFDWDWAAANLLAPTSRVEYDRVAFAAWNEFDRATRAAYAEYSRVAEAASDEYDRITWDAYTRATDAARDEYARVKDAARVERNRAFLAAWDEYTRAASSASAGHDRVRAAAFARLYVTERG